jgi:hypothetical protein
VYLETSLEESSTAILLYGKRRAARACTCSRAGRTGPFHGRAHGIDNEMSVKKRRCGEACRVLLPCSTHRHEIGRRRHCRTPAGRFSMAKGDAPPARLVQMVKPFSLPFGYEPAGPDSADPPGPSRPTGAAARRAPPPPPVAERPGVPSMDAGRGGGGGSGEVLRSGTDLEAELQREVGGNVCAHTYCVCVRARVFRSGASESVIAGRSVGRKCVRTQPLSLGPSLSLSFSLSPPH